jgi:NDP-mannose synthase
MVPVVIQAGGKGTRLLPYTTVLPKPLMPIGDVPIIEIVLRQLRHSGFRDIHVSIGHLGHLLRAVLGNGRRYGLRIRYLTEDVPLGTIGPFRRLDRPDGPVMVMNGDLLTDIDYSALVSHHLESKAALTIGVYHVSVPVSLGVLDIEDDGRISGFREKPTIKYWASMGVYVLSPVVWDLIPPGEYFGFDTLMEMVLGGELAARVFRFNGIWLDIGRPEDYQRAAEVFHANRHRLLPDLEEQGES